MKVISYSKWGWAKTMLAEWHQDVQILIKASLLFITEIMIIHLHLSSSSQQKNFSSGIRSHCTFGAHLELGNSD